MTSFTMRIQSALLASLMMISANSVTKADATTSTVEQVAQCICKNKTLSLVIALSVAAYIRLKTRPKVEYSYSYEEFKKEVEDILSAFNIFDKATRAKILNFIDKYIVGAELKIEDTTTRTKNEDGSVFTIKGKKLMQKPTGMMGIFDAYILAQAKKVVDSVTALADLFEFINNPSAKFIKTPIVPATTTDKKTT